MANKEHLATLKQGVEVWNQWRKENPDLQPDLSGANLNGANLSVADLRRANLRRVYLSGADLSGANLSGADLNGADLGDADLFKADLSGAHLSGADLSMAGLSGANLSVASLLFTNLIDADLENTVFEGAVFGKTIFGNVDLSQTKGLEKCIHQGPSIIDHETLMKSGNLPDSFLRGCGLPDVLINFLPTLRDEPPIQFYSFFISYSHKDDEFARRLHADLQDNGVRCWFAPEDLKIGQKTRRWIDDSIRVMDKLLLILSENSIASDWVEYEADRALEQERKRGKLVLFPIRLDDSIMEAEGTWSDHIRDRHIGDFKNWKDHDSYQKGFERLLRDMNAEGERSKD